MSLHGEGADGRVRLAEYEYLFYCAEGRTAGCSCGVRTGEGGGDAMTQHDERMLGDTGELRYEGARLTLRGRALRLMLWLAAHQSRINETAPESGQIWLTWKGDGPRSIDGDIKTRL